MAVGEKIRTPLVDELCGAILTLRDQDECYRFFLDVCTVGEIRAMAQRLAVAKMLQSNCTYASIVERTGASTTTISRVKRALHYGADGYKLVLDRLTEAGD